jgi:pSer/pThr/pTyr-binding forkhead associated (FHA) protein
MAQGLLFTETTPMTSLLVIATDQNVHAYELEGFARIGIGRHESNEIRLLSRAVSNFHAEILKENGSLVIRDLGSTNGTRVNGARVERALITPGDSIQIGNNLLSLQLRPPGGQEVPTTERAGLGPGARGNLLPPKAHHVDRDYPLAELLRALGGTTEALRVNLVRPAQKAELLLDRGRLFHAVSGKTSGEKALYRVFSWHEGTYSIEPCSNPAAWPVSICLPMDTVIEEGLDHARDLGKLIAELPPLAVPLRLKEDCPLPLNAHSPAEIEIFQAIIRQETIERVLETSPWTDLRVARLIRSLLAKRVFEAGSPGTMEETYNLGESSPR